MTSQSKKMSLDRFESCSKIGPNEYCFMISNNKTYKVLFN